MESTLCATLSDEERRDCRIIETFYADSEGIRHRDLHLRRLARTAAALGYPYAEANVMGAIHDACAGLEGATRCRLTVDHAGQSEITQAPLPPNSAQWRVGLSAQKLRSDDPWLQLKTTRRAVYDAARANLPSGLDELLFLNERDELCEGTITNLFVERAGRLLTPPTTSGCLPGILRQSLIEQGAASEGVLTVSDLLQAEKIWVGNALRGLIPVDFRL